jgi:hypothetical protein
MNTIIKNIIITVVVVGLLALAGYVGYRVYNNAIDDATRRIKQGVQEGVSEGIGQGIGSALNPLTLPKKIFGRN